MFIRFDTTHERDRQTPHDSKGSAAKTRLPDCGVTH